MKHSQFSILTATVLVSVLLTGCIVHVGADNHSGDVDRVFGSIDIESGRNAHNLSMVNGSIEMAEHSRAEDIETVNGSIELAEHVSIRGAETVNGSIEADHHLKVENSLETVNGDIRLGEGAQVGGSVANVNGDLNLTDAGVGGDVETYNGDVSLLGQTHVQGDVVFRRSRENRIFGWKSDGTPTLTIDEEVQIDGQIILERQVELEFGNPALSKKVIRRYSDE